MKKIKNEQGITLVSLVITIAILLVLASVAINVGTDHYKNINLKGFNTKLEVAQEGIEKIKNGSSYYLNSRGEKVYYRAIGAVPTNEQKQLIESLGFVAENFRYYTAHQIENELEISGVDLNLLIDFDNEVVICPEGLTIDGTTHYMINNKKYRVSKNTTKNVGSIDFSYQVTNYINGVCKVTIIPINVGDISKGIVEYKKKNSVYWKVANDNQFSVRTSATYDIRYTDANQNTVSKTIEIQIEENGTVAATENIIIENNV